MMIYQEIAAHHREAPDVFLCQRTIKSLQQENAQLKERLAHQLDRLTAILKEESEQRKISGG